MFSFAVVMNQLNLAPDRVLYVRWILQNGKSYWTSSRCAPSNTPLDSTRLNTVKSSGALISLIGREPIDGKTSRAH